jgi:hypothetical protein
MFNDEIALKMAYAQANDDPDRKEIIDDWGVLDGEDWEVSF